MHASQSKQHTSIRKAGCPAARQETHTERALYNDAHGGINATHGSITIILKKTQTQSSSNTRTTCRSRASIRHTQTHDHMHSHSNASTVCTSRAFKFQTHSDSAGIMQGPHAGHTCSVKSGEADAAVHQPRVSQPPHIQYWYLPCGKQCICRARQELNLKRQTAPPGDGSTPFLTSSGLSTPPSAPAASPAGPASCARCARPWPCGNRHRPAHP